ncbi:GTP 3',8-cyclase MoaA [Phascolarctobacterium succinatutens]|uniref:GTP 3',8-cyclase MoaA n=1 Tax=Phascolarctobacterium succinatutens TaxID=626940 RepID=UPI0026F37BE1|nr:GTP 3',8-cyclase MoaA [Phascolarctobacterium succinatutens]
MYDQYNRKIDYLRISLTDRCNLHCRYCRPEVSEHVPHNEILRYEELLRICRAALQLGIRKFKITGGEPLLRKGCRDFIASLKQLDGVEQVTLTTNGTLLAQQLPELIKAGVDSINVSLDTLDAAYYKELTGGSLSSVLQALQELHVAGIPFKLNCVPLAENGPADIMQLLKLANDYNAPLRFIELMPLDCNTNLQGLSGSEIRSLLEQAGLQLQPDAQRYGNGPASYWRIRGYKMPVGFIEPLHNKFCAVCNRVRLTSVGMLKPCLYSDEGMNLKHLLRDGGSDADLLQAMQEIIYAKPAGHSFDVKAARFNMSQIGG